MHSFATQKQITVKLGLVNYEQLKSLYRASLIHWLSFTHYLHPQSQNFNYSCFWCETACPLKRVLFNFLCEQEVRMLSLLLVFPLFPCKIVKLNPLFSQLPPSIPSRFLFSLSKWQGGRSRGGRWARAPLLFVCMFHYFWYNNNFWENLPKRSETTTEI